MDLYYSPTENIIFGIAGYTDNSSNVQEIIKMLEENRLEFCQKAGIIRMDDVRTDFINKSSRYKNMRVFYLVDFTNSIPENCFSIGEDWTIWNWLTN